MMSEEDDRISKAIARIIEEKPDNVIYLYRAGYIQGEEDALKNIGAWLEKMSCIDQNGKYHGDLYSKQFYEDIKTLKRGEMPAKEQR